MLNITDWITIQYKENPPKSFYIDIDIEKQPNTYYGNLRLKFTSADMLFEFFNYIDIPLAINYVNKQDMLRSFSIEYRKNKYKFNNCILIRHNNFNCTDSITLDFEYDWCDTICDNIELENQIDTKNILFDNSVTNENNISNITDNYSFFI